MGSKATRQTRVQPSLIAQPSAPTQHRPNSEMGLRDSFSRLKEKLKLKSRGRKPKPDDARSSTDGEGVGSTSSLPLPVPYAMAGGSNVDGRQVRSTGRLPQLGKPEFVPNNQEGGPGREWDGTGMGEVKRGHPTPSIPSAPRRGKLDGM